jgi:hypothetical protein
VIGEGPAAEVREPGFVQLSFASKSDGPLTATTVAVNVNPAESDPARITLADFEKTVVRLKELNAVEAPHHSEQERQTIWRYLLLTVLLVLAAESFVASRTA